MVRVFLAGVIQGSRSDDSIEPQDYRQELVRILKEHIPGAHIYNPFELYPGSVHYDDERARRVFWRLMRRASRCDILVAYLPVASLGTALEMYLARKGGALVLTVSPMRYNWTVKFLSHRVFEDLSGLERYLSSGEFRRWLARRT